jgi:hypothetical protein
MKQLLFILLTITSVSCNTHDDVNDEYARGFYNAKAIFQHRYSDLIENDALSNKRYPPDWEDCKRSYLNNEDLYNYWNSVYEDKATQATVNKPSPIDSLNHLFDSLNTQFYEIAYAPDAKENIDKLEKNILKSMHVIHLIDSINNNGVIIK